MKYLIILQVKSTGHDQAVQTDLVIQPLQKAHDIPNTILTLHIQTDMTEQTECRPRSDAIECVI